MQMKQIPFYFTMLALLLIVGCGNKQQSTNTAIDNLIVGKWKMVEYAGGSANALDTISFYENIFRSVLFFAIMRPDYNFSHRESPPLYLYAVKIVHVPFWGKKSPFALSGAK